MSTKTMKQRIAVVAVSALTAGVLSVASAPVANAAIADLTIAANAGAAVVSSTKGTNKSFGMISPTGATDLTSATVVVQTAVMYDSGTLVVWADGAATNTVVTVSGGTITSFDGTATLTGLTTIGSTGNNDFGFAVKPTAAGTLVSIKSYVDPTAVTASTGGTLRHTINATVTTAASAGTFSSSNSRVQAKVLANVAAAAVTSNADEATAAYIPNGSAGVIAFSLNDAQALPMSTSTVVSASATGGAVVSLNGATYSTSISGTYGGTFGNVLVAQGAANTPVTSTVVTLSVNGAVYATKSFKLVGDVASIVLSAPKRGLVSTNNATGAFSLEVKDSAGNLISGITPSASATSINASVINVTPAASVNDDVAGQRFECSSIRGTSTVTYTFTNAANVRITSNALPVVCAGNPYKYTASLDKASYTSGAIATLTIKATDLDGNAVSDYSVLGSAGAATTLSITCGTQMVAVTTPVDADTFTAGVKTIKYAVGTTAGSYNCVVDLPKWNATSTPQAAQTVAYTIAGDGSVSNAQVLQSIVALIASINKQIQALQKLILARR